MRPADQDVLITLFEDVYTKIGQAAGAAAAAGSAAASAATAAAEAGQAVAELQSAFNAHVATGALTIEQVNEAIAAALDAQPTLDLTKVPGYVPPEAVAA